MADYEKSSKDLSKKELISILVVIAVLLTIAVPIYKLILYQADKMNCKNNQEAAIEILDTGLNEYIVDDYTTVYEGSTDTRSGGIINVESKGIPEEVVYKLVSDLDEKGCVPLENEQWTVAITCKEGAQFSIELNCNNPKHILK